MMIGIEKAIRTRRCHNCSRVIPKGERCLGVMSGPYGYRQHICKVCLRDMAKQTRGK